MAFLPQDEQNQNAPQGQTSTNPQNIPPQGAGGSVGAGGAGPKAGSAPSTGSSTQFGSSASKLGDYLSANAPQITQQAGNIASGLNNQYGQVNQDITNAANQFQSQVQGGYAAPNKDIVNQATTNPTGFVSNTDNINAFKAQYNNQYKGPQNFEGTDQYGNIQGEVNSAVQNAQLLQSPAGLQSYLAGHSKNPTRASTTLDQLLLNGNPEAQATVKNAAKQFNNLTGTFGDTVSKSNQSAQEAQKAAQESQAYARGQFDPYVQNFGNQITQGAQTAEQQRQAYNNSLNNFYNSAVPVEQQINQWAGMLPGGTGSIQDLIAPIISANNAGEVINPITAQNFSTPEQYAQAQAIQQLLGGTGQLPIDQSTANQAGTSGKIGAPLPSLQDVLGQYAPIINNTYSQALKNPVNRGSSTGIKQTSDLVKYLASLDPQHYQWSQGATPIGDFSFNP